LLTPKRYIHTPCTQDNNPTPRVSLLEGKEGKEFLNAEPGGRGTPLKNNPYNGSYDEPRMQDKDQEQEQRRPNV